MKNKDFAFYAVSILSLVVLFGTPVAADMIAEQGMPGLNFCEFLIQSVDKFVAVKS